MILRAVERDQHPSVEAVEHLQSAIDPLKLIDGFSEYRTQQQRRGRIEHVPNMIVAGDFSDAEQTGAVGAAMPLLEPPLMCQERRALHEKHREGRHSDVAHAKGRIHATPLVRKPVQAASQRPKQGIEQTHAPDESHSRVLANPLFWCGQTFHPNCCIRDSPPLPRQRLNRIENCWQPSVMLDNAELDDVTSPIMLSAGVTATVTIMNALAGEADVH